MWFVSAADIFNFNYHVAWTVTVMPICGMDEKASGQRPAKVFGMILSANISERLRCVITAVDDKIHYQELRLKVEFGENSRKSRPKK
jgi:hypothetical protein